LAVGDALGVPVEFRSRDDLRAWPVEGMSGYGTWNQPPGTWSDDSSLTFCLAESLVNGYNLHDISSRFVRWYREGYWGAHHKVFDIGGTTRRALARIEAGKHPLLTGDTDVESNGNGSLMRIVPAALFFSLSSDLGFYLGIREVSGLTHAHFRSVFSCYIFSEIVRELLNGRPKPDALRIASARVSKFALDNDFKPEELNLFNRILSGCITSADQDTICSGGYVLNTLESCIWCFMTTNNYTEAVLRAVNLGEDTDTTACVTGALAGLYYGESAIPAQWRNVLAREKDIVKLSKDFTQSLKKMILPGKT
jgi:ADP-ribosyl-[dinitrogen reductase] hydrolase